MVNLVGKKAIVCGASGGMGRAVSLAFAREGIHTALMARNEVKLKALAQECAAVGTAAEPVSCDIARMTEISVAVEKAVQALGGLNILFNCAGVHKKGKAFEVGLSDWDEMLDINFRAHYTLVRHALPVINKSPGGAVIKIGSIAMAHSGGAMHRAFRKHTHGRILAATTRAGRDRADRSLQ